MAKRPMSGARPDLGQTRRRMPAKTKSVKRAKKPALFKGTPITSVIRGDDGKPKFFKAVVVNVGDVGFSAVQDAESDPYKQDRFSHHRFSDEGKTWVRGHKRNGAALSAFARSVVTAFAKPARHAEQPTPPKRELWRWNQFEAECLQQLRDARAKLAKAGGLAQADGMIQWGGRAMDLAAQVQNLANAIEQNAAAVLQEQCR